MTKNDEGGDTDDIDDTDDDSNEDNKLSTFTKICDKLTSESGHHNKTAIVKQFITKGTSKNVYKGDLSLFVHMLLPNSSNRVFNLNSISLCKLYSRIFGQDQEEMLRHLNKGDVADTIKTYFEKSSRLKPSERVQIVIESKLIIT